MKIGIVGSEKIKFTALGEFRAKNLICDLLSRATEIVSGRCHLGGIDIWAAEIGQELGIKVTEFIPEYLSWPAYKERNLNIAKHSDIVYCISVDKYPLDYKGMRFNACYHCMANNHIKSGGCWTIKQARKLHKEGMILVVKNFGDNMNQESTPSSSDSVSTSCGGLTER